MEMGHLRYECNYDRMAEEICNYTDWDPMLVMTGWTYEDLSRIGQLIADLVEGDVVYNQTLKSFYHGNLTPNDRLMVHGSDATHAVAELSDAENLAQYDNMEPCVYISPGNRPHIIQYWGNKLYKINISDYPKENHYVYQFCYEDQRFLLWTHHGFRLRTPYFCCHHS